MAHNSRIRAPGTWTNGSTLLATEMASFDATIFGCINGDAGGTWNPVAQIVLGGSGLSVTGPAAFDDITAATFNGTLTVATGGFLYFVNGAALTMLNGAIGTVNGNAAMTFGGTSTLTMSAGTTLSTVNGTTISIAGAVSFTATAALTYNSAATINFGNATVTGAQIRTGQTILSGTTGAIGWRDVALTDADQTVTTGSNDVYKIPDALGADRGYVLGVPLNSVQARITLYRSNATANIANVLNWNGVLLHSLDTSGSASPWAEFFFNSTDWVLVRFGKGG
jgi:hypothetical protein